MVEPCVLSVVCQRRRFVVQVKLLSLASYSRMASFLNSTGTAVVSCSWSFSRLKYIVFFSTLLFRGGKSKLYFDLV